MIVKLAAIHKTPAVREIIRKALKEDVGHGDVTTGSLIPKDKQVKAIILTREDCTVSGVEVAASVFRSLDRLVKCRVLLSDGQIAAKGQAILKIEGSAASILTAERTALNIMQRMCGIATQTAGFVKTVKKYGTKILDTRKTTPNMRILEKYAVLCGGGTNHRFGLYDMVLVKDNHRALRGCSSLAEMVRLARKKARGCKIEVEVESISELTDVLKAGPDWVMLDNMKPAMMKQCVALCRGKCSTEASGGITMQNILQAAKTGVDAISLGCLTHSVRSVDLSLEIAI